MNEKGIIFDIQRFCLNDGPGIRTTVFLKGCPMRCLWCHNPESQSYLPEIGYYRAKCVGCGACVSACASGCHSITAEGHEYNRHSCTQCGACAEICYANALELIGRKVSAREVMDTVLRDKVFYDESGGGLTLSGGEPMAKFPFALELLRMAKEAGIHTCVETSGCVNVGDIEQAVRCTDIFLYDYKETDTVRHKEYTGVGNENIMKNLFHTDRLGGNTILRAPIVPGYNDREDHFQGLADAANRLAHVMGIDIEPYHPLGKAKSERIGRGYGLDDISFTDDEMVRGWIDAIQTRTAVPVKKG